MTNNVPSDDWCSDDSVAPMIASGAQGVLRAVGFRRSHVIKLFLLEAIARAIVNDPPILLADEPTGNLDSSTSQRIMILFRDLNQDGQTILMVTHNPDNLDYSTVGYYMLDGRLSGLDSALRTPIPIQFRS